MQEYSVEEQLEKNIRYSAFETYTIGDILDYYDQHPNNERVHRLVLDYIVKQDIFLAFANIQKNVKDLNHIPLLFDCLLEQPDHYNLLDAWSAFVSGFKAEKAPWYGNAWNVYYHERRNIVHNRFDHCLQRELGRGYTAIALIEILSRFPPCGIKDYGLLSDLLHSEGFSTYRTLEKEQKESLSRKILLGWGVAKPENDEEEGWLAQYQLGGYTLAESVAVSHSEIEMHF